MIVDFPWHILVAIFHSTCVQDPGSFHIRKWPKMAAIVARAMCQLKTTPKFMTSSILKSIAAQLVPILFAWLYGNKDSEMLVDIKNERLPVVYVH